MPNCHKKVFLVHNKTEQIQIFPAQTTGTRIARKVPDERGRMDYWKSYFALVGLCLSACEPPGLPTFTGSEGSIGGTWVGSIHEDGISGSAPLVLHIEQVDQSIYGVLSLPYGPPYPGFVPLAGENDSCNMGEGVLVDGGLTFRLMAGTTVAGLYSGGYDATTETLAGQWTADTLLDESHGRFEVRRVSWESGRTTLGIVDYLGCSDLPPSQCLDDIDNDEDGLIDDEDPGCIAFYLGGNESFEPRCQDGLDNDNDGLIDDEDPECPGDETGQEPACSDGLDNDQDGLIDLDDPACNGDPRHFREVPPMCEDGLDNDGDGHIDGDDPECSVRENENIVIGPGCSDGYDNDGDGLLDLDDPSCHGTAHRYSEAAWSTCDDGLDNDRDGLVDEDESNCSILFFTFENGEMAGPYNQSDCEDNLDNDGDGLTDREDTDCSWIFVGNEVTPHPSLGDLADSSQIGQCADSLDNDGDGLVDMDDPGCSLMPISLNQRLSFESPPPCLDGQDNDDDGLTDREDPDCTDPYTASELPECSNGLDDDFDGLIDNEDPACSVEPGDRERRPQCDDNQDNDGNGLIDMDDPACFAPYDEREVAACSDGLDNDGDGYFDLADDGCSENPDSDEEL